MCLDRWFPTRSRSSWPHSLKSEIWVRLDCRQSVHNPDFRVLSGWPVIALFNPRKRERGSRTSQTVRNRGNLPPLVVLPHSSPGQSCGGSADRLRPKNRLDCDGGENQTGNSQTFYVDWLRVYAI